MKETFPARELGEQRNVIFVQNDPVMQAFRDGKTKFKLSEYVDTNQKKFPMPLSYIMLGSLLRNYIIYKVKAPLMKAIIFAAKKGILPKKGIIMAAKRLPKPTRENCYYHNTIVLIDIFERFFGHFCNKARMEMMEAARDIFLATFEHDIHYAWIFNWFAEELAKEVASGNFKLNDKDKPFPIKQCWKE